MKIHTLYLCENFLCIQIYANLYIHIYVSMSITKVKTKREYVHDINMYGLDGICHV